MESFIKGLQTRGITDERVLDAFSKVDRSYFVESANPYADEPQAIGFGQTISQPYVVALMLQELNIRTGDKVLEVGVGSGYVIALLTHLCRTVVGTELVPELVERTRKVLSSLEEESLVNSNYEVIHAIRGAPEQGPYDKILVSAAAKELPDYLLEQLTRDGVLLIPVGEENEQWLVRVEQQGDKIVQEKLAPVHFVPLL